MTDVPISRRSLLVAGSIGSGAALVSSASAQEGSGARVGSQALRPTDFGARCDGIADDTVAIQALFDRAAGQRQPPPILIEGPCRIEGSVRIRRPVDTTDQLLRVTGFGAAAGLIRTGRGPMFIAERKGAAPQAEFIRFTDLVFRGNRAQPASLFGDGFLRMSIVGCEFYSIACLQTGGYAQEWRLERCIARGWEGYFFDAAGGYHVTSAGGKYQSGDGGFRLVDPNLTTAGSIGCSFMQDIYESCQRPFLEFELGQGVSVIGLYAEGNRSSTIRASLRSRSSGVSVSGCFFGTTAANRLNADFAEIAWGDVVGGHSSGNVALGRLHHFARGSAPVSVADVSGTVTRAQ